MQRQILSIFLERVVKHQAWQSIADSLDESIDLLPPGVDLIGLELERKNGNEKPSEMRILYFNDSDDAWGEYGT